MHKTRRGLICMSSFLHHACIAAWGMLAQVEVCKQVACTRACARTNRRVAFGRGNTCADEGLTPRDPLPMPLVNFRPMPMPRADAAP